MPDKNQITIYRLTYFNIFLNIFLYIINKHVNSQLYMSIIITTDQPLLFFFTQWYNILEC